MTLLISTLVFALATVNVPALEPAPKFQVVAAPSRCRLLVMVMPRPRTLLPLVRVPELATRKPVPARLPALSLTTLPLAFSAQICRTDGADIRMHPPAAVPGG